MRGTMPLGSYAAHGGQGVSGLRIAVVGAGHMGSLHAQKVADLMQSDPMLELVGIADIRFERARALAERLGVRAAVSAEELLDQADAVIVAVPTVSHFEVVQLALKADCDVLVEKPIAATMAEGEELLEIAEARGRLLQVGHLEWFNKAMQVMRHRIKRTTGVAVLPVRSTRLCGTQSESGRQCRLRLTRRRGT